VAGIEAINGGTTGARDALVAGRIEHPEIRATDALES
jgi:hypothetical protein